MDGEGRWMGCILEKKSLSSEYNEVRVCALCYELVYSRVMLACSEIGSGNGGEGDHGVAEKADMKSL